LVVINPQPFIDKTSTIMMIGNLSVMVLIDSRVVFDVDRDAGGRTRCKGAPSVFDASDTDAGAAAPIRAMTLESTQVLEGGAVWFRYRLKSG
jgi:hypothetical protein